MEKNILQILHDLVNISSFGKIDKDHPIIIYLKEEFKKCLEIVEVETKNGNTHLLVGINTKLNNINNCVLLSGHIDTVAPSEGHNAISTIENGNLVGMGSSDMKSFIASIISKIEELKNFEQPIILSITSDEEHGLQGINKLIEEMKSRKISFSHVIIGEPTDSKFSVSNRGNAIYVSEMHGIPCHSGTPELGVNAIIREMEFIKELEKITNEYADEISICVTSVEGGHVPSNIVPELCSACFSIRTSDIEILSIILKRLEKIHREISMNVSGSNLFNVFSIPPFKKNISECIDKTSANMGIEITESKFTTEAGYIQQAFPNADIIIFGPGNPECIHKAGEKVNIEKLYDFENKLIELIKKYYVFDRSDDNNHEETRKF